MSGGRSRITPEQRRLMLEFIKHHPSISTGRFEGLDGARQRTALILEMSNLLNSQGNGATKSPEKWLRSWQDWKSDVKQKAAAIARHARGTGGGPPKSQLTELEKEVVEIIGTTAITGIEQISDPLNLEVDETITEGVTGGLEGPTIVVEENENQQLAVDPSSSSPTEGPEQIQRAQKRKIKDDSVDYRIAAAMKLQAESTAEIAKQLARIADVGEKLLQIWLLPNNDNHDN